MEEFVHLHTHSDYSNLRLIDSINKIVKMVEYTGGTLNQSAMALTDHESLSGHIEFLNAVKKLKSKGKIREDFKPILGNEIYLVKRPQDESQYEGKYYHFLLLAKDAEGHRQIRELSTLAWEGMYTASGMERVPTYLDDFIRVIGNNKGHLIGSTACLGSYFAKLVREYNQDDSLENKIEIHKFMKLMTTLFGEDFYIELQPCASIEQVDYNTTALMLARAYGVKPIFTTDAHYLTAEDRKVHKAYLNSKEGDREVDDFYSATHFFTNQEVYSYFMYLEESDIEDMMNNTLEIADKCTVYSLERSPIIPRIKMDERIIGRMHDNQKLISKIRDGNYPYICNFIDSPHLQDKYFVALVLKGLVEKIEKSEYDAYLPEIEIELDQIWNISETLGDRWGAYFTTIKEMIDIMWRSSIVLPSRGSACCFVINYLLDIVQIDRTKSPLDLPYWRFMSKLRADSPDIDVDSSACYRARIFNDVHQYFKSIGGDVLNVCTFGTEQSRSAVLTACRALGINDDIGKYMSGLIPSSRGETWTLADCYYGNVEEDRSKSSEFIKIMNEYPDVWEVAQGIEGLVNKRSIHACGVIMFNEAIHDHNAVMRAPNGTRITQFSLHDSEAMGGIKYDFLTVEATDKIQVCMELLVKYKYIDWKGSIKETYKKYLHPTVINYDSKEMWDKISKGEIISLFQFDSLTGAQAIKNIQPASTIELCAGNSLMRLMGEKGQEQPLDKYVRFKQDLSLWYAEMEEFGLTPDEVSIMENHLKSLYGLCDTQEVLMKFALDPKIANGDIVLAHKLRKGIAKKDKNVQAESKELFINACKQNRLRDEFIHYIWDKQIAMSLGYSFSCPHVYGYTVVSIQEANLAVGYPSVFWNTAVLIVDSGSHVDEEFDGAKNRDYGKMASAFGTMKGYGVQISLPSINQSGYTFEPDVANNRILYGLKGITGLNDEIINNIIDNRPYKSIEDFKERIHSTPSLMDILIKSGAMTELTGLSRIDIYKEHLYDIGVLKRSLNMQNFSSIWKLRIIPIDYEKEVRYIRFKSYVSSMPKLKNFERLTGNKQEAHHVLDPVATDFFISEFASELEEGTHYYYDNQGRIVVVNPRFNSSVDKKVKGIKTWVSEKETLEKFNSTTIKEYSFNEAEWEMEALSFYYTRHYFDDIDEEFGNFNEMPENPITYTITQANGRNKQIKKLYRIGGTVIDKNKNKRTVKLLTQYGVVDLKFYSNTYSKYDRSISELQKDKKGKEVKKTIEDSWFKRGTHLIVSGYRSDLLFIPCAYSNSTYNATVSKVHSVKGGRAVLQTERG